MIRKTFALLMLALLAMRASCQEGGDLEAQILYAYHTEDASALQSLAETLTTGVKAEPADPVMRYHLAHTQYRRGLLLSGSSPHQAEQSFGDCVDELKPLATADSKSAEALLLQSACYAELAAYHKLEATVLRLHAAERLKRALALEPGNPRALLISAEADAGRGERAQATAKLEAAVRQFDATSATQPDSPAWGHADAYLALGEELERRGDLLGARNWMERALITAPDYKAAQRRLAALGKPQLTSR